jgi:FkbM family methyltransferase
LSQELDSHKTHRIPGRGFLKDFFKIHGPIKTLKGWIFFYYSEFRMRRLRLDPSIDHAVQVNGYNLLVIPGDTGISAELILFKTHEPLTTKILMKELKEGMVCLDIGSNIGYYAVLESKIVGKRGKVIAIEPSPLNFRYLRSNLKQYPATDILTYNIAVGNRDGTIKFLTTSKSNRCKIVEIDQKEVAKSDSTIMEVPIRRIDSLLSDINLVALDFVRMDPEGYEASIYRGMKSTIKTFRPKLLIEFHRKRLGLEGSRQFLQELKEDGYYILSYIARLADQPIIANAKYVERVSIDELLKKLAKGLLPEVFSLFLVNKEAGTPSFTKDSL